MIKYLVRSEQDVIRIIDEYSEHYYTSYKYPNQYPAVMVVYTYGGSGGAKIWWECSFIYLSDFNQQ